MKKLITILAVLALVFGFAGIAAAEEVGSAYQCDTDPGYIKRGCEEPGTPAGYQTSAMTGDSCYPFDFEDFGGWEDNWCDDNFALPSYCTEGAKGIIHRAVIHVCDCQEIGTIYAEDTIDISMEILVDSGSGTAVTGNNGVYWAQDVNSTGTGGIALNTYASYALACADEVCAPDQGKAFVGDFTYSGVVADGTPLEGTDSDCVLNSDLTDNNRVWKISGDVRQTGEHGYTADTDDEDFKLAYWWIDIPYMRVDPNVADSGDEVYVKITLTKGLNSGGICDVCEGCNWTVYIGKLCCPDTPVTPTTCSTTLDFTYLPKTSGSYFYGLIVTNLSSTAGTVDVALYEQDGDVFTGTDIPVSALATKVIDQVLDLSLTTTGAGSTGTLGDVKAWVRMTADFEASGFAYFANDLGQSMGYKADKCSDCESCYHDIHGF